MIDPRPIACSLGAGDLQARLKEISAIGDEALICHQDEAGGHVLRFRADATTRRRLQEIVAAESACCPFLELELTEHEGQLVLRVAAPEEAGPIADELALAFRRRAE
jgi:NAD(P)H-dependent flavin oxidoreductase YrpB (nitropropane dioxygenase family)